MYQKTISTRKAEKKRNGTAQGNKKRNKKQKKYVEIFWIPSLDSYFCVVHKHQQRYCFQRHSTGCKDVYFTRRCLSWSIRNVSSSHVFIMDRRKRKLKKHKASNNSIFFSIVGLRFVPHFSCYIVPLFLVKKNITATPKK